MRAQNYLCAQPRFRIQLICTAGGLLACVELVRDKSGPELFSNVGETGMICRDFCIQNGLMMRAVRDGMIMSPALTITKNEIDEIINKFEIALEQTMKKII